MTPDEKAAEDLKGDRAIVSDINSGSLGRADGRSRTSATHIEHQLPPSWRDVALLKAGSKLAISTKKLYSVGRGF